MNVAFGSAFRNSGGPGSMRYFEQIAAYRDVVSEHQVRAIVVEGDSTDNTREALTLAARYHRVEIDLVTCNHGGPVYGSTEQPERFQALSKVGNAIFDAVRSDDDALVYVESDLRWEPETVRQLVNMATNYVGYDVIAPMVMAGTVLYDIWGFRGLDGRRFSPFKPYHPDYSPDRVFEVGSVGSCLVMRGHVARLCRIRNDYCLVGWCEDAREKGFRIAVRPNLRVQQL